MSLLTVYGALHSTEMVEELAEMTRRKSDCAERPFGPILFLRAGVGDAGLILAN